jgi:RNA polymerase sigma-70 factor (ECF subfamily)
LSGTTGKGEDGDGGVDPRLALASGGFGDEEDGSLDVAQLVADAQAGDTGAFTQLYEHYFDRVYGYLRVLLNDHHEAEDATQQIFMQVFERLGSYEKRRQPFRAWLFVVARNYALTLRKHNERLTPTDPAEINATLEDEAVSEDAVLRVLGWIKDDDLTLFIERLPLVQRQILMLRYLFDLTDVQIAKILDRGRDEVRSHQYRAMVFLRKRLAAVGRTSARRDNDFGVTSCPNQAFVLRERRFSLWR